MTRAGTDPGQRTGASRDVPVRYRRCTGALRDAIGRASRYAARQAEREPVAGCVGWALALAFSPAALVLRYARLGIPDQRWLAGECFLAGGARPRDGRVRRDRAQAAAVTWTPVWTHPDSACRGEPVDTFFPLGDMAKKARALAICGRCPVRRECLEAVMKAERGTSRFGIVGGKTAEERRAMVRNGYRRQSYHRIAT